MTMRELLNPVPPFRLIAEGPQTSERTRFRLGPASSTQSRDGAAGARLILFRRQSRRAIADVLIAVADYLAGPWAPSVSFEIDLAQGFPSKSRDSERQAA